MKKEKGDKIHIEGKLENERERNERKERKEKLNDEEMRKRDKVRLVK